MTSRRRAFTLLEMIVVIGLFVVLSFVATRLVHATLRTWRESEAAQAAQSRFDQAMGQMRRDVWSARSIEVPSPRRAILGTAHGTIEWDAIDPAGLERSAAAGGADRRRWEQLGALTFSARGPALAVDVHPSAQEAGGRQVLTSQSMLLEGRPQ